MAGSFQEEVRRLLVKMGIKPNEQILGNLPSTTSEARAIAEGADSGIKNFIEVPPRHEIGSLIRYKPLFDEIVMEIATTNPELYRDDYRGRINVPGKTRDKIKALAGSIEKDKKLIKFHGNPKVIANLIRALGNNGAVSKVYVPRADNIVGLFEFFSQFYGNYGKKAHEISRYLICKKIAESGKSGGLRPIEGVTAYLSMAKANPLLRSHWEESAQKRGLWNRKGSRIDNLNKVLRRRIEHLREAPLRRA